MRWEKVLKIITSKDGGQTKVDRLRKILLLEATYNFTLELVWSKRLMRRATTQNLLQPAQHTRPHNLAFNDSLNIKSHTA